MLRRSVNWQCRVECVRVKVERGFPDGRAMMDDAGPRQLFVRATVLTACQVPTSSGSSQGGSRMRSGRRFNCGSL
jgi:hypothetical protein